jgi:hypothetical protein
MTLSGLQFATTFPIVFLGIFAMYRAQATRVAVRIRSTARRA